MSMRYYIKHLRLVTPQTAPSCGVKVEAPAFVSPGVTGPVQCPLCEIIYSPLVYQTGYEIVAQHFHGTCGGIYLNVVEDPDEQLGQYRPGWLALMEPIGRLVLHGWTGMAEAVRVLAIEPRCMGTEARAVEARGRRRFGSEIHDSHLVTEGRAWRDPSFPRWCLLNPVCDEISVPARNTPFRFTLRDGQVFFSIDH